MYNILRVVHVAIFVIHIYVDIDFIAGMRYCNYFGK